jgi:ribosome-associated protein
VHTDNRAADAKPGDGVAADRTLTRADLPPNLAIALDAAVDKGARHPVILEVSEIAGYTDWVMIVSARNERQVSAIVDAINIASRNAGSKPIGVEGTGEHLWDLLDFDDFMVHVFFHPVRTHYDLESMWSDAPRVSLGLPPDVMDTTDLEELALPDGLPAYHGDATFGGFDDEFGDAPPPTRSRPRSASEMRPRPRRTPATPPDDSIAAGQVLGRDDDFGAAVGDDDDDDFDDEDFDDDEDFAADDDAPDESVVDDELDDTPPAKPEPEPS